jgi:hypothetical protein
LLLCSPFFWLALYIYMKPNIYIYIYIYIQKVILKIKSAKIMCFLRFWNPQIPIFGWSKWLKITERIKDYFFFLNTHLMCSQFSLTLPMGDHHLVIISQKNCPKNIFESNYEHVFILFYFKNSFAVNKLCTNFLTFILNCSNKRKYFTIFPSHAFNTLP